MYNPDVLPYCARSTQNEIELLFALRTYIYVLSFLWISRPELARPRGPLRIVRAHERIMCFHYICLAWCCAEAVVQGRRVLCASVSCPVAVLCVCVCGGVRRTLLDYCFNREETCLCKMCAHAWFYLSRCFIILGRCQLVRKLKPLGILGNTTLPELAAMQCAVYTMLMRTHVNCNPVASLQYIAHTREQKYSQRTPLEYTLNMPQRCLLH